MGMSERAQEGTKWRLGELARVRGHHGHASAVRLRRQQENGARPARPTRTTFDLHRAEDPQARVGDFVQRKDKFFFCGDHCVSRREKNLDLFRSVDFEVALGRCDVRTNTVVPVVCLRLGTPRRCCTSRNQSCNGVHALSQCSGLLPPLSPSLSR